MKKLSLVLSIISTIVLTGCFGSDEPNYTNEEAAEIVDAGLENIEIGFASGETLKSVLSDVELPTSVKGNDVDLDVVWKTSNPSILSTTGKVNPDSNERTDVVLSATISLAEIEESIEFNATVLEFDSENVAYSRALQYFRNSSFDPLSSLPDSVTESDNYINALNLSNCSSETGLDSDYEDDCFTDTTNVDTQSDAYEDILEVINAFSVIKEYSTLAEEVITDVDGEVARNQSITVPGYGKLKVLNTGTATDSSYTFATNVKFTTLSGVSLELTIQNELSYDEDKEEFTAKYTFDIEAGYLLFNVSIYTLSAQVTTDQMYNLTSLEVASQIPLIGSKMSKLIVNDDKSIELFSYRQNLFLSNYKSYIYANNDYGTSYYWTSGNPLNPFSGEKSSFEVFTPDAKIYELNLKGGENPDDEGAAKFYFSGLNGYDRVEVNKPTFVGIPTGRWEFKLTSGSDSIIHENEAAGDADFRIEKESAYKYVEEYNDSKFVGYSREKTGEDTYYVAVYNNNLYTLPTELRDFGMTTQVTNIESTISKTKSRLSSLQIMGSDIFETPGEESNKSITITIPGINKEISL